jgi:hypothetical protein
MFSVSATASRVHAAPAFVTKVSKVCIFYARRRLDVSTTRARRRPDVTTRDGRRRALDPEREGAVERSTARARATRGRARERRERRDEYFHRAVRAFGASRSIARDARRPRD